ncbi:MAG: hypothetical protein IKG00_09220 [Lachnospiraceae bacterium]|nr:hypothetical protein [Lachnospiraceae bacterium]
MKTKNQKILQKAGSFFYE